MNFDPSSENINHIQIKYPLRVFAVHVPSQEKRVELKKDNLHTQQAEPLMSTEVAVTYKGDLIK